MRVISAQITNFASYKYLSFDFENEGLTLIQGPTGSGKSTLCDVIPWLLFGLTAKNGSVDEVRNWSSEDATTGTIAIEINRTSRLTITRVRGKFNDLYLNLPGPDKETRGKDLADTQKLINNLLGFDSALYLSGAYFHEFSQTAQFFTTTAKNRRAICEQLVDLSLAKSLQLKIADNLKLLRKEGDILWTNLAVDQAKLESAKNQPDYKALAEKFKLDTEKTLLSIRKQLDNLKPQAKDPNYFTESILALETEIENLGQEKCDKCGSRTSGGQIMEISHMIGELKVSKAENLSLVKTIATLEDSMQKEMRRSNPYLAMSARNAEDLDYLQTNLDNTGKNLLVNSLEIEDGELLSEVVADLRGVTIGRTIQDLEDRTNGLLSKHFDAEIRVTFSTQEADKIEVSILKDGHNCSYTQLSKGQRQLLKLCFGVSVMRSVANHHGINFNCAFFDEALDGLDDVFKVKAYGLLEELSLDYESVFVVEHNEALKSMFPKSYKVQLVNGESQIG